MDSILNILADIQEESSTDEDEYIINKNNKIAAVLKFSRELDPFYFNIFESIFFPRVIELVANLSFL